MAFESAELYKEHKITCNEIKPVIPLEMDDAELARDGNEFTMIMQVEQTEEKPHICDTCYLVFESEIVYKQHQVNCRDVTRNNDNGMKESMKMELTEEKPFMCQTCSMVFDSEESYEEHEPTCCDRKATEQVEAANKLGVGNDEKELHVCSTCHMIFRSEDLWRNHSCSRKKKFVCETGHQMAWQEGECNDIGSIQKCEPDAEESERGVNSMNVVQNSMLTDVSAKSTIKKPHQCTVCEKSFRKKGDLTRHSRIHTDERPFQCDHCDKSFKQKSGLIKHRLTLSGQEKPHKCDQCEMRFYALSSLVAHIRTHTGEKPFKCDQCDKAFIQKSCLKAHYPDTHG